MTIMFDAPLVQSTALNFLPLEVQFLYQNVLIAALPTNARACTFRSVYARARFALRFILGANLGYGVDADCAN